MPLAIILLYMWWWFYLQVVATAQHNVFLLNLIEHFAQMSGGDSKTLPRLPSHPSYPPHTDLHPLHHLKHYCKDVTSLGARVWGHKGMRCARAQGVWGCKCARAQGHKGTGVRGVWGYTRVQGGRVLSDCPSASWCTDPLWTDSPIWLKSLPSLTLCTDHNMRFNSKWVVSCFYFSKIDWPQIITCQKQRKTSSKLCWPFP